MIRENLKELRKNKNNTQEDLARFLSVSITAVSKWERGECYPDIELLPGIALYYDVSVDDLLGVSKIRDAERIKEYNEKSQLTVALGEDAAGQSIIIDLTHMPHLLISGATGSGKSVCVNSLIVSLIDKYSPDYVNFIMIDPKIVVIVELNVYNGIPHLLTPVVTDPRNAAGTLNWAVTEMEDRFRKFADSKVRDIIGYNKLCAEQPEKELEPLNYIVIIIDELADLMIIAKKDVEDAIFRLAAKARAAGMHLVVATQRPTVDVLSGTIKANIPSRIAFRVYSQVDSLSILDIKGAEELLGCGDMLYKPVGVDEPLRVQGCYISDREIEKAVEKVKTQWI